MPKPRLSPEQLRERRQVRPGCVDGAALREMRQRTGLTVRAFADQVGLSESAVRNLELGHTDPSPEALNRIANRLGREPGELLIASAA